MRYLITGGAGFIGSHLAESLLDRGYGVHVYDNLSTGKLANVEPLYENDRFTSTVADVRDADRLEPVAMDCDGIFHLAAPSYRQRFRDHPVDVLEESLRATEVLLEVAERTGRKVVLTTSPLVYGKLDASYRPDRGLAEDDDVRYGSPEDPSWGRSYLEALQESMALAFHRSRHLPVVVTRLFNVVGPRQSRGPGHILPMLVERAVLGRPLELRGDGSKTVCLCYVDDAVWALRHLMESAEATGHIYNVGSTVRISLRDLAETVREITGSDSPIEPRYEHSDNDPFPEVLDRVPNLEAVRGTVGYEPTYSIQEMIIEMITEQPAPWTLFEPDR